MSFLEMNLAKSIKNLTKVYDFDTLIPFLEIHPKKMIEDSGKDFIRMFNSNTINGAKSAIINRRMRLNNKGTLTRLNFFIVSTMSKL